ATPSPVYRVLTHVAPSLGSRASTTVSWECWHCPVRLLDCMPAELFDAAVERADVYRVGAVLLYKQRSQSGQFCDALFGAADRVQHEATLIPGIDVERVGGVGAAQERGQVGQRRLGTPRLGVADLS